MKYRNFITLALFGLAAAAVYLVYIDRIGYQNDDWYLMYAARTHGADVFTDIYRIDRPARALVFIPAYHLFGSNVLYYNLSALLFRLAAAWCFGWVLQQLWRSSSAANFLAALLFFVYPGFLSQFNGIDYQAQMVSLAAAMASIAMSIKSQFEPKWIKKILWLLPAIVLGWFYLGLVEYFIGFELFRLMVFLILKARETQRFGERLLAAFRSWLPNFLVPSVFLLWRVFIFESERGATDIGRQISGVVDAPLATTVSWLVRLFLNSVDVTFSAWVIPLYQLSAELTRLREIAFVLLASVVLLVSALWWIRRLDETDKQKLERSTWQSEALIVGAVIVIAGLFPVIAVNRAVDFTDFSRYALASSAGSALILATLLFSLPSARLRALGISLLLVVAAFTQHANALKIAKETASLQKFWWQVAWRVPLIKEGTALIANYPLGSIQEDYFVWGPANLIYYPEKLADERIRLKITAIVLNKEMQLKILSGASPSFINRRSIQAVVNFQQLLVLSQPSVNSCVQIFDGSQPLFSEFEEDRIMLVASYSDMNNILLDAQPTAPPELIFGSEPAHDWCYFYEKAELARQFEDWQQVLNIGEEVFHQKLTPGDPVEWMPFIQAYARQGNLDRLLAIKQHMKKADPFVGLQVCRAALSLDELTDETIQALQTYYCAEK